MFYPGCFILRTDKIGSTSWRLNPLVLSILLKEVWIEQGLGDQKHWRIHCLLHPLIHFALDFITNGGRLVYLLKLCAADITPREDWFKHSWPCFQRNPGSLPELIFLTSVGDTKPSSENHTLDKALPTPANTGCEAGV